MSSHTAVEGMLMRLRDWWRTRGELASLDQNELRRIALDLNMTPEDLEHLASRGPDASDLLYERMRVLGLSRTDVENAARGLMLELEKSCACCSGKDVCEKDLKRHPDDPAWKSYCPNADILASLSRLKSQPTAS